MYPEAGLHAIIRAGYKHSIETMDKHSGDAARVPRMAPHPLLTSYYDDEPGRKRKVIEMFDVSARHYDWITDAMSFGTGRWYRGDALKRIGVREGTALLDVGCGTGVIAATAQRMVGAAGRVVAVDPSEGMLAEARKAGVADARLGRGEQLPVQDNEFDVLTMGYALRHVEDLHATFCEYLRALKPGGRVLLLEITRPEGRVQYGFVKFYLKHVIPTLTRVARRSSDAQELMRYYWDTIEACVSPQKILDALASAGFEKPQRHVLYGMFSEYTATKPQR
jgi:demethylmenaquinone methyltransferase/2-methoxy-6-polyprenyl-1,4-benzoquinol methylase